MALSVLCFASWGDALGPAVTLELPPGGTVADLLVALRGRVAPGVALPEPMVAVNRRYAAADTVLTAGDEIAVIPPVAGG